MAKLTGSVFLGENNRIGVVIAGFSHKVPQHSMTVHHSSLISHRQGGISYHSLAVKMAGPDFSIGDLRCMEEATIHTDQYHWANTKIR